MDDEDLEETYRLVPLSEVARDGCPCGGNRGWGASTYGSDTYCSCFAGLRMMARDSSVDFDEIPDEYVRAVVVQREHQEATC